MGCGGLVGLPTIVAVPMRPIIPVAIVAVAIPIAIWGYHSYHGCLINCAIWI